MRSGEVTVIDVRPTEECRAGHIPGARWLGQGVADRRARGWRVATAPDTRRSGAARLER